MRCHIAPNGMSPTIKRVAPCAILILITACAFWIRVQGIDRLPSGQFTETDAYLYYKQAKNITEQGFLPARDMDRWLPLGRDNGQLLSLYAYAIAVLHKVFPWWSLYQVQLYLPVLCWTLGLSVIFLYLTRSHGLIFAAIVGVILATLPGSIERSAAGFGDRDAWCWMLGVLAVISYLWKEQIAPGWRRCLATTLSGFLVFLGGLSWEAFGAFLIIIHASDIYKFCTTDTEQHLSEYLLWILMFVPWLYLISPAYHSGYGFAEHIGALILIVPLFVFVLRWTRYLLLKYVEHLRPHARKLAGLLTVLSLLLAVCYFFLKNDTYATTTVPFSQSRLMQNIGELKDPHFRYWTLRYGAIYVLGSLGLITVSGHLWKRRGLPLALSLMIFSAATFFREHINEWVGFFLCDHTFFLSLFLTVLCLGITCLQEEKTKKASLAIVMLAWFILWVGLARGGKRYDFFMGLPLAYGTAWLLYFSPVHLIQRLKDAGILYPHVKERRATAIFTVLTLIAVFFYKPIGGHATRAIYAASEMRSPTPGDGSKLKAYQWMKETLSEDSVIAANWDYGTQLNVFGGVKSIIDPDHYLPHWIHLYYRHVICAQSEKEALEFLKTHKVTHLILTEWGITDHSWKRSLTGSTADNDRAFNFHSLKRVRQPFGTASAKFTPERPGTPLHVIDLRFPDAPFQSKPTTSSILASFKGDDNILKTFPWENKMLPPTVEIDEDIGGIIFDVDSRGRIQNTYYVPPLGWNSLSVKLYFREEHSDAFVPVYPIQSDGPPKIKIWEIHYPPNIQTNDKYLETGYPEKSIKELLPQ